MIQTIRIYSENRGCFTTSPKHKVSNTTSWTEHDEQSNKNGWDGQRHPGYRPEQQWDNITASIRLKLRLRPLGPRQHGVSWAHGKYCRRSTIADSANQYLHFTTACGYMIYDIIYIYNIYISTKQTCGNDGTVRSAHVIYMHHISSRHIITGDAPVAHHSKKETDTAKHRGTKWSTQLIM